MKATTVIKGCVFICALAISGGVLIADDAAPEHSMTGCLQPGSETGTFRLTDLGLENGPERVEIEETSADIAGHVGHKVAITGITITGKDPAAHTMKVTALEHLAATCP